MLQKPWFKVFVWFMATFFFFLASGVVISVFRPSPTEAEVMQFMMGMMSAMDKSMMGVIMGMESSAFMQSVMRYTVIITMPVIITGIVGGLIWRVLQRRDENVQ